MEFFKSIHAHVNGRIKQSKSEVDECDAGYDWLSSVFFSPYYRLSVNIIQW